MRFERFDDKDKDKSTRRKFYLSQEAAFNGLMKYLPRLLSIFKFAAEGFAKTEIPILRFKTTVMITRNNSKVIQGALCAVLSAVKEDGDTYNFEISELELKELLRLRDNLLACYQSIKNDILKKRIRNKHNNLTIFKYVITDDQQEKIAEDAVGTFFYYEAEDRSAGFLEEVCNIDPASLNVNILEYLMPIPTRVQLYRYVITTALHHLDRIRGVDKTVSDVSLTAKILKQIQGIRSIIEVACFETEQKLRFVCTSNQSEFEIEINGEEDIGAEIISLTRKFTSAVNVTLLPEVPLILKTIILESLGYSEHNDDSGYSEHEDNSVVKLLQNKKRKRNKKKVTSEHKNDNQQRQDDEEEEEEEEEEEMLQDGQIISINDSDSDDGKYPIISISKKKRDSQDTQVIIPEIPKKRRKAKN